MYADIGPSSLKLQFIHAIQDVDDYRVEYAHLNKDKLEESQRVISLEHKTNSKNITFVLTSCKPVRACMCIRVCDTCSCSSYLSALCG